jgi:Fe-S-cluster containining protein
VTKSSVPECRSCGACCVNPPVNRDAEFPWWVEIADGDRLLARPDLVRKLVVRDPDGVAHLRLTSDGRCLALRGTVQGRTSCAIYNDRPTPCRTVQPGDALCLRYRHEHGIQSDAP